jgi:23S rRNA A1618 N6-methylase RlmF
MISERSKLEKQADKIFSDYIKQRDRFRCVWCQRLFHKSDLECSHFVARQHHATRWAKENADAACHWCHEKMEHRKSRGEYYYKWKENQIGEDALYELLRLRHTNYHVTSYDLRNLIKVYRDELKYLKATRPGTAVNCNPVWDVNS